MSDLFIYEFLFRGGPTSSPDDNTFHVVLARPYKAIDGSDQLELLGPLTPERAASLGYTLDRIVSELNTSAVESLAELHRQRDAAVNAATALESELGRVCSALDVALRKLQGRAAEEAAAKEQPTEQA